MALEFVPAYFLTTLSMIAACFSYVRTVIVCINNHTLTKLGQSQYPALRQSNTDNPQTLKMGQELDLVFSPGVIK